MSDTVTSHKLTNESIDSFYSVAGKKGVKRKRKLQDKVFCNADNKASCKRKIGGEYYVSQQLGKELENIQRNKTNKYESKCEGKDEQSVCSSNESWRSRCGRKRKYFGEASARQGATSRERNRFQGMKSALDALKQVIPKAQKPTYGNLSKYQTLKLAARYIAVLSEALSSVGKMDAVNEELRGERRRSVGNRSPSQSEASNLSGNTLCGLSEDELFTGDFSDMLFDDCENEDASELLLSELARQSFELLERDETGLSFG